MLYRRQGLCNGIMSKIMYHCLGFRNDFKTYPTTGLASILLPKRANGRNDSNHSTIKVLLVSTLAVSWLEMLLELLLEHALGSVLASKIHRHMRSKLHSPSFLHWHMNFQTTYNFSYPLHTTCNYTRHHGCHRIHQCLRSLLQEVWHSHQFSTQASSNGWNRTQNWHVR